MWHIETYVVALLLDSGLTSLPILSLLKFSALSYFLSYIFLRAPFFLANECRIMDLSRYRAMHIVLARFCYRKSSVGLSVCPSVRPSVTLWYREHIGWSSSKLITRVISLGSSPLGATTSAI